MNIIGNTYIEFIKELKQKISSIKNKAALSINKTMIALYLDIGRDIVGKQNDLGWGRSIVEQMAKDLQKEFGERSGYSTQNLWYMRQFFLAYKDNLNLQQLVGEIPWGQNILIFSKCKDKNEQEYYIKNTIEFGWNRKILMHHVKTNLFSRDIEKTKQNNFLESLPEDLSVLANNMMKSEYNLEFLNISKKAKELEVESAIVENIKRFILELGYGFTFVDNQYKLILEENEYFIDLLFFHRKLNCLVAIELKIGKFKPEYAGKMNFYLNLLNAQVKMPHENPAIGIILCTDKKNSEVEYALHNINQPLGVSIYTVKDELPEEFDGILPKPEDLLKELNLNEIANNKDKKK